MQMPDIKNDPSVSDEWVDAGEVAPILAAIEEVIKPFERTPTLIALTSLMLMLQHPEITQEELFQSVREVSKFTCYILSNMEDDMSIEADINADVDPKKLN